MQTQNKILVIVVGLLIITQVGMFTYGFVKPRSISGSSIISAKTESPKIIANENNSPAYGGILPHNLAVQGDIERYLSSFAADEPETIVLLAPNHLAYGSSLVSMANRDFKFKNFDIIIDSEITDRLSATGQVKIDNKSVADELSVNVLLPILAKHFPRAKFSLLVFKNQPNDKANEAIASALATARRNDKILVFGTVDFSHYLPKAVADFHDEQSRSVIENFDFAKISGLEIDSPAVLFTAMKYFSLAEAPKANMVVHTNTDTLTGNLDAQSTSHFFYTFEPGSRADYKHASILAFGDLMLDRGVRQLIDRRGVDYLFAKLKGEENRFFMGSDYVSANLEGVVTNGGEHLSPSYANDFAFRLQDIKALGKYNFNIFTTANNHVLDQGGAAETGSKNLLTENGFINYGCHDLQVGDCTATPTHIGSTTIAWLGFSQVYGKLNQEKVVAKIIEARKVADFVVVNIHWGSEYQAQFNSTQQKLAHAMVDAGADVVIGHHPHVVQGIEQYKKSLIFYSLGNFIFDQYFSVKTQQGMALGLNMTDKQLSVSLLPLQSNKSQPILMVGSSKKRFLEELSKHSDSNHALRAQINDGLVVMSRADKK